MYKENDLNKAKSVLFLFLIAISISLIWSRHIELTLADSGQNLTYMNWFKNPDLYQNSLLGSTHKYIFSVFYLMLGALGKYIDPIAVLYVVFFLTNFLAALSIFLLAVTFFKNEYVGYISVLILVPNKALGTGLGGSAAFGAGVFPGLFTIPFLLFAITLFLKERYVLAFFLTGIMFNFHGSHAIAVAFMFGLYCLLNFEEIGIKTLLLSMTVFFIGAIPLLCWMLSSETPVTGALETDQWLKLVRLRVSGHCFPFMWSVKKYLDFLPFAILFFLVANFKKPEKTERQVHILCLGILILCIIGTVFTEIIPITLIIKLTLFRNTRFFIIFAAILGSNYIVEKWQIGGIQKALALTLLIALFILSTKLLYPVLSVLILFEHRKKSKPYIGSLFVVLMILSMYSWQALRFQSNVWYFVSASLVCILLFKFIKWKALRYQETAFFIIVGASLISLIPFGFYKFGTPSRYKKLTAMKDVQLWLKDNTPQDKLIMTPPLTRMWSGFSRRGVFMNWVDLNYPIYIPHLGKETIKRANEYVGDIFKFTTRASAINAFIEAYNLWQASDFQRIANKYGCSVAIIRKPRKLPFKLLYKNKYFHVYSLNEFSELVDHALHSNGTEIEFSSKCRSGFGPANAIDGIDILENKKNYTAFARDSYPNIMVLKLKEATHIEMIEIGWYRPKYYAEDFKLSYFDGKMWREITHVEDNEFDPGGIFEYTLKERIVAEKIRLEVYKAAGKNRLLLNRISIY